MNTPTPVDAAFAGTWDDLARHLGTTRRSLQDWRKRFPEEYPQPVDGQHSITAWRAFIAERDLGRGNVELDGATSQTVAAPGSSDPAGASPGEPTRSSIAETDLERASIQEVKRLREIVGLKRELLALDEKRDAMIPAAEYEAALSATLGHFRAAMLAHPRRATGKLVLRVRAVALRLLKAVLTEKQYARIEPMVQEVPIDYADIEEVLDGEVDLILRTLQPCDHLQPGDESE